MLRYQLPMMIITNTKDIFLKRIKKLKKMITFDFSSQQSSSNFSQNQQTHSFSSSIFIRTIKTQELQKSIRQHSLIYKQKKNYKQTNQSIYNIFHDRTTDLSDSAHQILSEYFKIIFSNHQNQFNCQLAHLIIDFDDIDSQKAVKQYKKIKQREKQIVQQVSNKKDKESQSKKSKIFITPLDYFPQQSQQSGSKLANYQKSDKNAKKKLSTPTKHKEKMADETVKLRSSNDTNADNVTYQPCKNYLKKRQAPTFQSPGFHPGSPKGNETHRNLMNSPSNAFSNYRYFHQIENPNNFMKDKIQTNYFQPKMYQNQEQLYYQNKNQALDQAKQRFYLSKENNGSHVVRDSMRRQTKERATALLQKVKSLQKRNEFGEDCPRKLTKFRSHHQLQGCQ